MQAQLAKRRTLWSSDENYNNSRQHCFDVAVGGVFCFKDSVLGALEALVQPSVSQSALHDRTQCRPAGS
jgi:hypothetical protein